MNNPEFVIVDETKGCVKKYLTPTNRWSEDLAQARKFETGTKASVVLDMMKRRTTYPFIGFHVRMIEKRPLATKVINTAMNPQQQQKLIEIADEILVAACSLREHAIMLDTDPEQHSMDISMARIMIQEFLDATEKLV